MVKEKNKKTAQEIGELRELSYAMTLSLNIKRSEIKEHCRNAFEGEGEDKKAIAERREDIAVLKMSEYKLILRQNEIQAKIKELTKELINQETNADLDDYDEDLQTEEESTEDPDEENYICIYCQTKVDPNKLEGHLKECPKNPVDNDEPSITPPDGAKHICKKCVQGTHTGKHECVLCKKKYNSVKEYCATADKDSPTKEDMKKAKKSKDAKKKSK